MVDDATGFQTTTPPTRRTSPQHSSSALQLVLPAPMEEKEETAAADEGEWIATPDGGFLPLFLRSRRDITTLQEYKDVVVEERDRLVVVLFYAPWCRSCKAIQPQLLQLQRSLPQVKFVQVPVTQDTSLIHQGLGVPSVPFGHIYHPEGGLVEEMKMSKKHFADFATVLRQYVAMKCELPHEDFE